MHSHNILNIELLVVLLMIASAVAMAIKWIRIPYSIALVIVGLIIGIFHILPTITMTPDLILLIFLPALVFEASWNIRLRFLKIDWLAVSVLATVGVIFSSMVTAIFVHFFGQIDLYVSILLGAIVSATDVVSVVAVFKKMHIDKRLTTLIEGESLFNDGTAVVLFKLILGFLLYNQTPNIGLISLDFLLVCIGGILIGLAVGFLASKITKFFDDHLLEMTLTTIVAYGSYLLADQLSVSPVLAVVAAGIMLGNYGSRTAMSSATRYSVNAIWEYAAFLVNSLIFLLIGMQVKIELLAKYAGLIGISVVAILLARLVLVYGLCPFLVTPNLPITAKWRHILFWGGLRGALSMALALSLPLTFQYRETIIVTTFGIVLFTLLVQGLTLEPLVRWLKVSPKNLS